MWTKSYQIQIKFAALYGRSNIIREVPYFFNFIRNVNTNMKILSFDQATVKTGIAIHENDQLVVYDLINLEKHKVDMPERVNAMIKELCNTIHTYNPDYVVFEDIALQSNPSTLILLARLQGAIIGHCISHDIPYTILKPPTWRKALGFNQGKEIKRPQLKKQAVEYVKGKFDLSLKEDICEAVCIGEAFLKLNKK